MEYKGFIYKPWQEVMDDNIKVYHDVETPDGKIIDMDWSPYETPSFDDFKMWIELGMPKRIHGGPLSSNDLKTIMIRQVMRIHGKDITMS